MKDSDALKKVESYTVPLMGAPVRLSDFVPGIFVSITSKKGIKKVIKNQLVRINGTIGYTGDYIRGGEIIDLFQSEVEKKKPRIDLELAVFYEDEHLAIVYKPAGIIVSGNKKFTLENALTQNLIKSKVADALVYPQPIHRLDYPTSGLLLVGKTSMAVIALNNMFAEKEIHKTYFAIAMGPMMNNKGKIDMPIDDKASLTYYQVLERIESPKYQWFHLLRLDPKTGRRHQIRKHLASIGNPILGDREYGVKGLILKGKGLYLHAAQLDFTHPITKEDISVKALPPKKFLTLFSESHFV